MLTNTPPGYIFVRLSVLIIRGTLWHLESHGQPLETTVRAWLEGHLHPGEAHGAVSDPQPPQFGILTPGERHQAYEKFCRWWNLIGIPGQQCRTRITQVCKCRKLKSAFQVTTVISYVPQKVIAGQVLLPGNV